MGQEVEVEGRGRVAIVSIQNPPMNVMSQAVCEGLVSVFTKLAEDVEVGAIVLTGQGDRAFMAGANIKEFPELVGNPGAAFHLALRLHEAMGAIDRCPKPVIAAIHGFALGGGLELALACDLRIADETAVLGLPEVKLGLFPGAGGTQRLPRLIGAARALELICTGEPIDATEAGRIGLVNRVVAKGQALDTALHLASVMAERPAQALRLAKRAVKEGLDRPLSEGLTLEAELFDEVFQTLDCREGIQAFLEKRAAQVRHQ